MSEFIWGCKIGGDAAGLPPEADGPMRAAVEEAYERVTGVDPRYCFSGWGETLAEEERAVVEDREPVWPPWRFDVSEIPMHITCVETVGWDGTLWYRLGQRDVWTTDIHKSRDGSGLATRHLLQYAPIVGREDPRGAE